MKKQLPRLVYLFDLMLLAFWQSSLRATLDDWFSFLAVVGYLLGLRLISHLAVCLIELQKKQKIERFNFLVESRKQQKRL